MIPLLTTCPVTPHVKASLVLSFDFLRLYINAFAFQATLNRAVAKSKRSGPQPSQEAGARSRTGIGGPSLFSSDIAGNPDARFIYESIDAANSLLSTFNGFIDPVGMKFMPLKYYLYVIYAAVFLFKVRFCPVVGVDVPSLTCVGSLCWCDRQGGRRRGATCRPHYHQPSAEDLS